jgi:hypothetical protein
MIPRSLRGDRIPERDYTQTEIKYMSAVLNVASAIEWSADNAIEIAELCFAFNSIDIQGTTFPEVKPSIPEGKLLDFASALTPLEVVELLTEVNAHLDSALFSVFLSLHNAAIA